MRTLLIRCAAAAIAVGGVLAAYFWPGTATCVARCGLPPTNNFFDEASGPVYTYDNHFGLRILVAAAALAIGAVLAATTFER